MGLKFYMFLMIFLIMFFFRSEEVCTQETEESVEESFYSEASFGYHHYNVKGYRGKVGEYDLLDTGTETRFMIEGHTGKNYFDIRGDIIDEDEQAYSLNCDIQRILKTDFIYRRFRHFLDHDPLINQDSATDYDAGKDNGITLELINADNTITMPFLPF